MTSRASVLAEVAARVPRLDRPVLVAVDGVDGSGKTWFGDELAAACASWPGPVVRASVDGFHHPQSYRHAHGRTGETFWSRSFDYAAFLSELVLPWRAGPGSDGSDPDPAHPSQARYVAGQRIYLDTCDPRARADVVVDNSDLAWPRIV